MSCIDLGLVLEFSGPHAFFDMFDRDGLVSRITADQPGPKALSHCLRFPNHLRLVIPAQNNHPDASYLIRLQKLTIGRMPVAPSVLPQICRCQTNNDAVIIHTSEWIAGTAITIDFAQDSMIKYLLSINNKFEFS